MSQAQEHVRQSQPERARPRRARTRPEPYVIVLFGATGDLAKRKLLPGLYHLFVAGLLPEKFRDHRDLAAGSSRCADDDFAQHAQAACDQFGTASPTEPWDQFAVPAVVRRGVARRPVAAGVRRRGGREGDRQPVNGGRLTAYRAAVPPGGAAVGVRVRGADARRVRAGQRRLAGDHREAVRRRPGLGAEAERGGARGVRRVAGLPDRPLPRQGVGRQHPRLPVRQRAVRADLEPAAHQVRADRRAGDAVRRGAGRRSTTRPAPTGTWW